MCVSPLSTKVTEPVGPSSRPAMRSSTSGGACMGRMGHGVEAWGMRHRAVDA